MKPLTSARLIYAQQGFTLLELMVAMSIFAVLAVAGWQVFDGLNRSKDRAQIQTTALSELQFAYLQIQKDMAQAVAYQMSTELKGAIESDRQNSLPSSSTVNNDAVEANYTNALTLSADSISFVRFADPDPRYQSSPLLERVVYRVDDDKLVRQRFTTLDGSATQTPLQSILVSQISQLRFQALTPDPVDVFPDANASRVSSLANANTDDAPIKDIANKGSLPKGISINYEYQMGVQQIPVSWQFALPTTVPVVAATEPPKSDPKPNPEPEPNP